MTKAQILKKEILSQYRSVRQFALEMQIPYSTLVTALERGIDGMAYGTVIKMCNKLNLNPVDSGEPRDAVLREAQSGRAGQDPGPDGRFRSDQKIQSEIRQERRHAL